jgi:hypothetical protein
MVSFKTSMAAFVAALGMGSAASAAVVTISESFYNASFSTRRFSFSQFVQGSGIGAADVRMVGSLTITLTDMNGNGARIATSGTSPIYRATVDGVTVKTIYPPAWAFQVNDPFGSQSTVPVTFNEALPAGVDPNGMLGIDTVFELSAGDAAYVSATFEIPGPGSAAILGIAGLTGLGRRRRK